MAAEAAPEPGPSPVRAAGAVLWRDGDGVIEVALVHRPRYDDWSFPKGKAKHGEHPVRTAVREVAEETGVTARLGIPLPTARYSVGGRPKTVEYWAAEVVTSEEFKPGREVDALRWVPVAEALGLLTHAQDAALLRAFAAPIRAGAPWPCRTRPVVVLRHACAGEKRFWQGSDLLRPLDDRGRWESTALTPLLAAYAPGRVVSSGTARCVETVLDYALSRGLPIATDPAFTVGPSDDRPDAAARLRDLIAESPDGLLICTHGEIIPLLLNALADPPPDPPTLRKSEFRVFHLTPDGLPLATEHHAPHPTKPLAVPSGLRGRTDPTPT
ncbi:NUDIX hydrolase [Actinocorallia sp. A-T 12471]|uniref:NUDIX hydrolase n=1 Tax=Actinocorallia sp. A-T 12471 TaxID=3089813 RepID=UPI0029D2ED95|nr:NUDIX hydrolase [Actinocorallia sp. A-T 12471]MDX6745074.1 NUDIX hydrolase [Actinocorallia sp. A-T 12471]